MKALTLTQPGATLIALGEKRIETRSWPTNYTGLLAIHAAKGFPKWAKETIEEEPFFSSIGGIDIPVGVVLCIVKMHGCRRTKDVVAQITEKERAFGDYHPGRFAWFLELVEVFPKPITAKGNLGLWDWTGPELGVNSTAIWNTQGEK